MPYDKDPRDSSFDWKKFAKHLFKEFPNTCDTGVRTKQLDELSTRDQISVDKTESDPDEDRSTSSNTEVYRGSYEYGFNKGGLERRIEFLSREEFPTLRRTLGPWASGLGRAPLRIFWGVLHEAQRVKDTDLIHFTNRCITVIKRRCRKSLKAKRVAKRKALKPTALKKVSDFKCDQLRDLRCERKENGDLRIYTTSSFLTATPDRLRLMAKPIPVINGLGYGLGSVTTTEGTTVGQLANCTFQRDAVFRKNVADYVVAIILTRGQQRDPLARCVTRRLVRRGGTFYPIAGEDLNAKALIYLSKKYPNAVKTAFGVSAWELHESPRWQQMYGVTGVDRKYFYRICVSRSRRGGQIEHHGVYAKRFDRSDVTSIIEGTSESRS
jgi:hypothetical protein